MTSEYNSVSLNTKKATATKKQFTWRKSSITSDNSKLSRSKVLFFTFDNLCYREVIPLEYSGGGIAEADPFVSVTMTNYIYCFLNSFALVTLPCIHYTGM